MALTPGVFMTRSISTSPIEAPGPCACCNIDLTYAPSYGRVVKTNGNTRFSFCLECEPYLLVMLPLVKELREKSAANVLATAKAMF